MWEIWEGAQKQFFLFNAFNFIFFSTTFGLNEKNNRRRGIRQKNVLKKMSATGSKLFSHTLLSISFYEENKK